jgi:hypothetical protein
MEKGREMRRIWLNSSAFGCCRLSAFHKVKLTLVHNANRVGSPDDDLEAGWAGTNAWESGFTPGLACTHFASAFCGEHSRSRACNGRCCSLDVRWSRHKLRVPEVA